MSESREPCFRGHVISVEPCRHLSQLSHKATE